jgi:hypothetical protein
VGNIINLFYKGVVSGHCSSGDIFNADIGSWDTSQMTNMDRGT